jgi:hypothetical protein
MAHIFLNLAIRSVVNSPSHYLKKDLNFKRQQFTTAISKIHVGITARISKFIREKAVATCCLSCKRHESPSPIQIQSFDKASSWKRRHRNIHLPLFSSLSPKPRRALFPDCNAITQLVTSSISPHCK